LLAGLVSGCCGTAWCQTAESHLIKGVEYSAMLDGYCAMAALQMNLKYYGFPVDQSLLLNLGWDYGFLYMKTAYFPIAYPDTDPVEELVFACRLLGFKAAVLAHKTIEEARQTLVKSISENIPVIVQWIPHTVLAYGYSDNGDKIVFNDPGDYKSRLILDSAGGLAFGKGEKAEMAVSDWNAAPYMWGLRQYQMVVVEPGDTKSAIDWKAVWKRNAEKTLGLVKSDYPAFYGIDGIKKIVEDVKYYAEKDAGKGVEFIKNFEMCFKLGEGFRRDGAAFLGGQASVMKDKNLQSASIAFLNSANYFRKGFNLIGWIKDHSGVLKAEDVLREFIGIFEDIVKNEIAGAEFLLKASK
jgi:hypothetical protein